MINIILFILVTVSCCAIFIVSSGLRIHANEFRKLNAKYEDDLDRIVHLSSVVSELSEKVDALEDYMKMVRSESENDKHKDYWESVMEYNPYLHKEDKA